MPSSPCFPSWEYRKPTFPSFPCGQAGAMRPGSGEKNMGINNVCHPPVEHKTSHIIIFISYHCLPVGETKEPVEDIEKAIAKMGATR